jgi:hypothetical protein
MRILVACEYSGTVRSALSAAGHDAWSCDILPTERPGNHIQADVLSVLDDGWDMMIAHPPCTYLSYVGVRWYKTQPDRMYKTKQAFNFFMALVDAPIPRIAIENPRGFPNQWYRKPDQIVQPWQFGDPFTKMTCLWLKGLPPLLYTCICTDPFVDWSTKGKHVSIAGSKSHARSKTFDGIANAMATQWTVKYE